MMAHRQLQVTAMPTSEFLCDDDGVFERMFSINSAPMATPCPHCAEPARRIVSAPRVVGSRQGAWSSAVERAERSRHEPEVVSAIPRAGGPGRPRTLQMTPQLRGLPRP